MFIEDSKEYQSQTYEKIIEFTSDKTSGKKEFRWNYDSGELLCNAKAPRINCVIDSNDLDFVSAQKSSFVYLDVGVWSEYDGQYNFGLISGPDVYLMEFLPKETSTVTPTSKNETINNFLDDIKKSGHSFRVVSYAQAQKVPNESQDDQEVYLFLPDYHLPPISWFYKNKKNPKVNSEIQEPVSNNEWLLNSAAFRNLNSGSLDLETSLRLKNLDDSSKTRRKHKSDIFGNAGNALVLFLSSLVNASFITKKHLHIIHIGDMFELWMNRPYQFRVESASDKPVFVSGGVQNVQSWLLESMLMNLDVMKTHREIEGEVKNGNIAEIKYIWGNHDAYLMYDSVTSDCEIPARTRSFDSSNSSIHAEHGHRFDSFNHDYIKRTFGGIKDPWGVLLCNMTFKFPGMRKLEEKGRKMVKAISHGPEFRDIFVLGSSIIHLNQIINQKKTPFGIFVMGHTHIRDLGIVNIGTKYHDKKSN